jgi:serine/threonine protein kinase
MGEVYRARDTKLKREVEIKILPDEFSRDADRVNRFQREAKFWGLNLSSKGSNSVSVPRIFHTRIMGLEGRLMISSLAYKEALAKAEEYGVDISLLRERLRWTPTERIERHQAALTLAEALRHARRKSPPARRPSTSNGTHRN